mgnify:CR=1 FL=1
MLNPGFETAVAEVDRQAAVEYDLSKTISDLMERDKRKIGVLASVPIMGSDTSPYMMQMMQMMQGGAAPLVDPADKKPEDKPADKPADNMLF